VSARDKATGKEQRITITASTNLSKEEIERMIRDAELHAAEDKRRRELIELKNQSDSLAYQSEKSLRELGDKVDPALKSRVEGLIKDLREAISQENESRMRSISSELQQAMYQVSQSAYTSAGSNGAGAKKGKDEGVVEGEYTVE
jgi:Molecular chaperone